MELFSSVWREEKPNAAEREKRFREISQTSCGSGAEGIDEVRLCCYIERFVYYFKGGEYVI